MNYTNSAGDALDERGALLIPLDECERPLRPFALVTREDFEGPWGPTRDVAERHGGPA